MPHIKIDNFSGIVPRTGPTQLEPNQAQEAKNVRLTSRELRSWKKEKQVFVPVTSSVRTVYKLNNPSSPAYRWLEFASDVDIVNGPVADTVDSRIYYTGDSIPKKTNWALATTAGVGAQPFPNAWLHLGVPAPSSAPTLTVNQPLKNVEVIDGGSGYTSAPTVSFSSGSATAIAKLDAQVSGITVTTPGSGYTTPPTVIISGGEGAAAVGTAVLDPSAGSITSITMLTNGSGYTSAPAVTILGGGGYGATATAVVTSGIITAVNMVNTGSGYTSAPTISFVGGGGTGASAQANVGTSGVISVHIDYPGGGYQTPPNVYFSGGGGSGAAGTASITGPVGSVEVTSGGSYSNTAPTVTFSGGGGTGASATANFSPTEDRAYVYTNISTFGSVKEESGPSPATNVTVATTGATVEVSGFSSVPTTNYNITHRRIYRTLVGATSVNYVFVTEIPVATTSFSDTLSVTQLGEPLPSLNFEEPPAGLQGLVSLPNGMLAGFVGNEVWFCEPYLPHAWPSQYMITVDSEIVGLGAYDTSLVVMTKNQPYILTGTSPGSMTQVKLPMRQPCVSKRSIAFDQYGVLYASPNGIVSIGSGSQDVITVPLYTREEWQEINPSSIIAAIWNNLYVFFYETAAGKQGLIISRGDIPPLASLDFQGNGIYVDKANNDLFAISNTDNNVYQLDADNINRTFYEWKSKQFIMPNPMNYGAIKIKADFGEITDIDAYNALVASITAANQALFTSSGGKLQGSLNDAVLNKFVMNGSILTPIPPIATPRSVNAFLYGDGELIWNSGVTSQDALRLPAGKKYYKFEIKLSGNVPVQLVAIATDISELRMLA